MFEYSNSPTIYINQGHWGYLLHIIPTKLPPPFGQTCCRISRTTGHNSTECLKAIFDAGYIRVHQGTSGSPDGIRCGFPATQKSKKASLQIPRCASREPQKLREIPLINSPVVLSHHLFSANPGRCGFAEQADCPDLCCFAGGYENSG